MKDSVPLDRSLVKVLKEYQDVSDQLKDMEKRKTGLSNQLKAALGEHEEGKFDNGQIVRWKRIEKNLLDSKRLKAEKPEIYNQYTSVNAYRTLSIAS